MKPLRYFLGALALLAFFLVIDSSGIGFRGHLEKLKSWARGETKRLRFVPAQH